MEAAKDSPQLRDRAEFDAQLSHHIVEAEAHLKAVCAQLAAGLGTDANIGDLEQRIAGALDALMVLRRQL